MAYSKTTWVNGQTPINDTNLNKIENELEALDTGLSTLSTTVSGKQDELTAGDNITIENNVISASGGTPLNEYSTSTINTYSASYVNTLNTYSTTETRVGTWLNNKPLYRKIFEITNFPNNTINTISVNIANVDKVISIRAIAQNSSEAFPLPQYYSNTAYDYIGIQISSNTITNIRIKTVSNRSDYSGFAILEYTKTTD